MTTAAAESVAARFLPAVLANASGALPWFMLGRTGKTQKLLIGSLKLSENPNHDEQVTLTKLRAMVIETGSQGLLAAAAGFWC